jgi:nitrogen fixation/metabolism regulation signal transduction histidine kinase
MAKSALSHPKKEKKPLAKKPPLQEKIDTLTKAFEHFTEETSRLEDAYQGLQKKFKTVNDELEEANRKLENKVVQLDAIIHYLHSILSNISQGLVFIDLNGIITTYNEAAKAILEVDPLDVLFTSFWTHFRDDLFGFSMREALSMNKSPETIYATIETSAGVKCEVEVSTTFIKKGDNDASPPEPIVELTHGIIVLMRDITNIRVLQEMANRNDRLKALGEMAARVAHEIRNPLGGIKGFAALLKRDLEGQKEQQEMASYIIEGTNNLNRLVTNILNFSRPVHPTLVFTDLIDLLREVHQHVQADSTLDAKISIVVESSVSTLVVPVDPQLVKSAFLNLIVNAIQAMPPTGGKIHLQIDQEIDKAIVTIADTGIGIPEENLVKVFSPFFTTKSEGTGLGLAEVHKVIQAHGGDIEVFSKVGKGSTFIVTLPLKGFAVK